MEASTLTHAGRRGFLARRSPLLRLQGDERLVAMIRGGHNGAFDVLVERYQARLLGFCRHMLRSQEDAEDVLQEVFIAAYRAMLADSRSINVRPWLYRIARNRCLNQLRRPVADGQDSMDVHPHENGTSTHERVQYREEFRSLVTDIGELPETQKTALLLREIDAMSYGEIAQSMDTTVPSVKSLLVRARISLAEASQSRVLTCSEVRVDLAAAAEGLDKASGPVRRHVRGCEPCKEFRAQLRSDDKALAALFPVGPVLAWKALAAKLGIAKASGAGASGAAGAAGGGSAISGALGGAGATGTGGIGGVLSGILGVKAAAGVATAMLITAGAVEVDRATTPKAHKSAPIAAQASTAALPTPIAHRSAAVRTARKHTKPATAAADATAVAATAAAATPAKTHHAAKSAPADAQSPSGPVIGTGIATSTGTPDDPGAGGSSSGDGTGTTGATGTTGPTGPADSGGTTGSTGAAGESSADATTRPGEARPAP